MTITPNYLLRFTTDTSDKIWGALTDNSQNQFYTFWGKVGGVVAFKAWSPEWKNDMEIRRLYDNKRRKGYKDINFNDLPYAAQEKYEQAFAMATLGLLRVK
jgi:predicted DNA-binding WGR domain protein